LNRLIDVHFGVRVELRAHHGWVAIDGKTLRGTLASGAKQSVVLAVSHECRTILAQAPMRGSKASEITVVRDLLKESSLEEHKVTLDAHHCNPETTAQIHQAGGQYLIHIKDNQPSLLKQCQDFAVTAEPLSRHTQSDKGHGRLTTREAQCFDISGLNLAARWRESGIQTLVVMKRQTEMLAKQKTTCETAYYMSNQGLASDPQEQAQELTGAIRAHWHVESENWIRDVMSEDSHSRSKRTTSKPSLPIKLKS
jgi:predicted transposase YbfD/YdcC